MTETQAHVGRRLVSLVIVTILASQAFAGFYGTGRMTWPIINYPMYARAHFKNERLDHAYDAYAVLQDGARILIDPKDLGMSFWVFQTTVVSPARRGDDALLATVLGPYCERHGGRIARVELQDKGIAIGRNGLVIDLPPETAFALDVSC